MEVCNITLSFYFSKQLDEVLQYLLLALQQQMVMSAVRKFSSVMKEHFLWLIY